MKGKESIIVMSTMILAGIIMMAAVAMIDAQERVPTNEGSIYLAPDEGDELTPSGYPVRDALPGDELLFNLWVGNNHTEDQTILMELVTPDGWHVSVTGSIIVPAGGREQISLIVIVPTDLRMDPVEDYSIRVEGVGNLTGDRASIIVIIKVDADVDHEIFLSPSLTKEEEIMVYPGQRTFIDILIRNQGDIIDDVDVRIMDHQTDWDIAFKEDTDALYVTLPFDESGAIFRTRVLIEVPESANIGLSRTVTIQTTSNLSAQYGVGTLNDEVNLYFKVVPPSSISIHPEETLIEMESGGMAATAFTITMSGAMESSFEPMLKVYSGSFQQAGWTLLSDLPEGTILQPGEIKRINVDIQPPQGIAGKFEIIMEGTSDNAQIIEGKLSIIIRSGSNIDFTDLTVREAKMGSDILVDFRVLNNGDSTQQVVLDYQNVPSDFIVEMEPSSFILESGMSRSVSIILYAKTEDIPLEFQFGVNIKVPISENNEWKLIKEITVPITVIELPNVKVDDIEIPDRPIEEGEVIDINVTISNPSAIDLRGLTLEIYEITWSYSNVKISTVDVNLMSGQENTINFNWTARPSARKIRAKIISPMGIEEMEVIDNDISVAINVRPKSNIDPGLDGEETGTRVPAETAVGAAVAGSVILTAIALLVNTDLVRYPFWSGIYPLYSKLKPEHLLSNRLRKRIYVYVQNNPGDHFRGILVNLNLTNGTLAHHLYTLEKESLIRSQRDGLYRRFYPAGYQIDTDQISLSPIQKNIMEIVESEPGLSQKEIAEKLSLSNSTVNYNIKALKEKEAIEIKKKGKSTHIFPSMNMNS